MKKHAPATLRNREAIAGVLAMELPAIGLVLEIASGSGEHAVYFAERFPALEWQPSDCVDEQNASITAWREEAGLVNLRAPIELASDRSDWPISAADAIFCANMIHISPWATAEGLFAGASLILGHGAPLLLYGPFIEDGIETAPSNLAFDESLKSRNPQWGIRSLEVVDALANSHGFERSARHEMPANNLMLVYRQL